MKKQFLLLLATAFMQTGYAQVLRSEARHAEIFNTTFVNICIKNLANLDKVRNEFTRITPLPAEQAENFLRGHAGNAWVVPNPYGDFILAIPAGEDVCTLYARRADIPAVERHFANIGKTAPRDVMITKDKDERVSGKDGKSRHTSLYHWQLPDSDYQILLGLTTSQDSDSQAVATAAVIPADESAPAGQNSNNVNNTQAAPASKP